MDRAEFLATFRSVEADHAESDDPGQGLKINTLLPPAALPTDLVPPEPQPAGNPVVELQLEGSPLVVQADLNGKSVRRALKVIAEHGPENVNVVL